MDTNGNTQLRTDRQNRSLHVYLRQVAEILNAAGYSVEQVLTNFTMELSWSEELVKEILWRTAQKRMLGKQSTTSLLKKDEIDDIVNVITRFLGERLHIENPPPFPSIESLELNEFQKI